MHTERLLAFAKFLDELPEELFVFETVTKCEECGKVDENMEKGFSERHNCGAVGCAIGWLPAFDRDVFQWRSGDVVSVTIPSLWGYENFSLAARYFDVGTDIGHLFALTNRYYAKMTWNEVKPKHVAGAIRRFVSQTATA